MRLEAIEVEDKHGRGPEEFQLLKGILVSLASAAVPAVVRAKSFCLSKLLKTTVY